MSINDIVKNIKPQHIKDKSVMKNVSQGFSMVSLILFFFPELKIQG